jgi:hypothetical protein
LRSSFVGKKNEITCFQVKPSENNMSGIISCGECKSNIFPGGQVFLYKEKMFCGTCVSKAVEKEAPSEEKMEIQDVFELVFKAHNFLAIAKERVTQKTRFMLGPEIRTDLEEIIKEIDVLINGFIKVLDTKDKNEMVDLSTKVLKIALRIELIC